MHIYILFVHEDMPRSNRSGVRLHESTPRSYFYSWFFSPTPINRLVHAHFGLSAFFITQNGAAKGGIRIAPTIADLVNNGKVSTVVLDV